MKVIGGTFNERSHMNERSFVVKIYKTTTGVSEYFETKTSFFLKSLAVSVLGFI